MRPFDSGPSALPWFDTAQWTVIIAAVVAAIGFGTLIVNAGAGRREHHRWLQEKRREAFVDFLTATRTAYDAIEKRGSRINAAQLEEDYHDPESDVLKEDRARIDTSMGQVMRARDVLAIVGPKDVEEIGNRVVARLKLDRVYYSPKRRSQLDRDREKILRDAEATGDPRFLNELRAAWSKNSVDLKAYRAAHHNHRLDALWAKFTKRANRVLDETRPRRWRRRNSG